MIKPIQDEFVFSEDEKCILHLALTMMQEELNKFLDKKCEYGDMTVSVNDIEQLKEYLNYG